MAINGENDDTRRGDDTIMVGVDGSRSNQAAVKWAADLAHSIGSSLRLVHVVDESARRSTFFTADDIQRRADSILSRAAEAAAEDYPDVTVAEEAVFGRPSTTLRDLASTSQMLVVGRRGHGGSPD
jgi:nucleotide-binding universal stress UspA family protein